MALQIVKNTVIAGSQGKRLVIDVSCPPLSEGKLPVVVYAHGFNGFKDWGNFDIISNQFSSAGFIFVKFNFSHNGTGEASLEDFVNLDLFAENNYTKELDDLDHILAWLTGGNAPFSSSMDIQCIALIGHSMGGSLSIIKTAEDKRISSLITWAAASVCKTPWADWSKERMDEWRNTGVQYYLNNRTRQQMPLHYQLYEDYVQNQARLNVIHAAARINVPWLICHGYDDATVALSNAKELCKAQPKAELFTLPGDHVFGRRHPWTVGNLPHSMQEVVTKCIGFLRDKLYDNKTLS